MKDHPRYKQLMRGVREDGTVEGSSVETHVALPMQVLCGSQYQYEVSADGEYVAILVDSGATDLEVRLPFEHLLGLAEHVKNLKKSTEGGGE